MTRQLNDLYLRTFLLSFALALSSCLAAGPDEEYILNLLNLEPGDCVADVGAGDGEFTVRLARRVGPEGKVLSTEVDDEKIARLRDRFTSSGLSQVEVLKGSQTDTALPEGCCDAILLRLVYHHFDQPELMNADFFSALKPMGRLIIIDFPPTDRFPRSNVPEFRGGHGIDAGNVVREISASGLNLDQRIDNWDTAQNRYLLVFVRPEAG